MMNCASVVLLQNASTQPIPETARPITWSARPIHHLMAGKVAARNIRTSDRLERSTAHAVQASDPWLLHPAVPRPPPARDVAGARIRGDRPVRRWIRAAFPDRRGPRAFARRGREVG